MIIYNLQQSLESQIYEACLGYIALIKADLNGEKIYAFNLYGSSGFAEGLSVAVSTRASLSEALKVNQAAKPEFQCPDIYLEMCADEWGYLYRHRDVFCSISEQLIELFDTLYEGCEFEDETDFHKAEAHILKAIPDAIIGALIKLKQSGAFNNEVFEDDVLLGYQLTDSGCEQLVQSSKQLNTLTWHDKVLQYQQYCLSVT